MGVTLSGAQLDDVLDALNDAAEYRWHLDDDCARCRTGICDDHRKAAQKAIRYASLALRLEKAAGHE